MSLEVETSSPNPMPHSLTSSITHIALPESEVDVPKDCNKIEEALRNLEVEWENDPDNARNWSFGRKWTAIAFVSIYNMFCIPS